MTDILHLPPDVEAQAYLGCIISSSDDAIISKDLHGNITSWNPAAERIFGFTAQEAVGKNISIIIPPESMNEEDYILGQVRSGNRVEHFETRRRRKDGGMVYISVTVSPIKSSGGRIIGASKIARDITDRIAAEKALRETDLKKDEFLANMSHELRTPMNAVIGLSNLLQNMKDMPDKAKIYINTLKTSADNLMNLINDLLDFAKIEAGSFEIENIEFNLPEEVEKVISILNVSAREKKIDLYVNYSSTLHRYYMGDPLRIHQILTNLVSNAIKFTQEGSVEVEISGKPGEVANITSVIIRVSDTGIGIENDKIDMIFEKFTQADSSVTRRFGGSGLGLAIAKACIDKMNGSITVKSEPGVGTTFTVALPLENTDTVSIAESFSAGRAPRMPEHKKNVLLVEDYEPNVMVAGAMLEDLGYNYDTANDGFEALRKFAFGYYDVILMDIQMHGLDGLEATRRIRQIEADKGLTRTPVIAMTAHVREQDKNQCLAAGMDDFITKPFVPGILGEKIAHFIEPDEQASLVRTLKDGTAD